MELCSTSMLMAEKIHIGEMIRREMDRKGVSQTELGEKMNKTRKTIWSMLQQEDIHTKTLRDLGDILGCDFFAMISEVAQPDLVLQEDAAEYSPRLTNKGAKLMLMVELDDSKELPDINEQLRKLMEKTLKTGSNRAQ